MMMMMMIMLNWSFKKRKEQSQWPLSLLTRSVWLKLILRFSIQKNLVHRNNDQLTRFIKTLTNSES